MAKKGNTRHPSHEHGNIHDGGYDRQGRHLTPSSKAIFTKPAKMRKGQKRQSGKR